MYDICILKGPCPYIFIVLYMDNFLFLTQIEEEVQQLKQLIAETFCFKDMRPIHYYLRVHLI